MVSRSQYPSKPTTLTFGGHPMLTPEQICTMEEMTGIPIDLIVSGLGLLPPSPVKPVGTFEEALEKYRHVPHGSREEADLILTWLALCTTAKQARMVFHYAPNKSVIQAEALHAWRKLSATEIERATDLAEACEAQVNAPLKSPESLAAMRKRLSFCTTLAEMLEAYRSVPHGSREKAEAIKAIATLFTS